MKDRVKWWFRGIGKAHSEDAHPAAGERVAVMSYEELLAAKIADAVVDELALYYESDRAQLYRLVLDILEDSAGLLS